jgi:hypothetical protein
LSRSLVGKLLHGPISRVMACAEVEFSSVGRPGPEASPGPKTDSKIRENGKPYIQREFKIESDQVFNNPA